MSTEKTKQGSSLWLILITGMLTGMGNGSVFGATLMCLLGRSGFANWGGDGLGSYNPATFNGFMTWSMLIFGVAFCGIMAIGLGRHAKEERPA